MIWCICAREVRKISEKTLAIRVDEDFYKKVKLRLAENGMTLKNYFVELVENDIKSTAAEKIEGYTREEILERADEITRLLKKIAEK